MHTIDISRWQGTCDFQTLKNSGVPGVWVKVGGADGGLYADSKGQFNVAECERVGLTYGTYYFVQPSVGDAVRQAQHAVSCGHGRGAMWPVNDQEYNPYGLSPGQLDDFCTQFNNEVQRLTGRPYLTYTGAYVGVGFNSIGYPPGPLWVANYGSNTPSHTPPNFNPPVPYAWSQSGWAAWQYNSTTTESGIYENVVDQNEVTDAFWNHMLGTTPPDEGEEEVPQRSMVKTIPGSAWALEHLGDNNYIYYILLLEGSGKARHLNTTELLNQELFWQGKTGPDDPSIWQVEDVFLEGRYFFEKNEETFTSTPSSASTVQASVFAVVLVALLWVLLELGKWAEWYSVTHGQIAALIAVTVVVAALVAAFVRLHGGKILAWLRRKS